MLTNSVGIGAFAGGRIGPFAGKTNGPNGVAQVRCDDPMTRILSLIPTTVRILSFGDRGTEPMVYAASSDPLVTIACGSHDPNKVRHMARWLHQNATSGVRCIAVDDALAIPHGTMVYAATYDVHIITIPKPEAQFWPEMAALTGA